MKEISAILDQRLLKLIYPIDNVPKITIMHSVLKI